jgi:hypothetical protein
MFGRCRPLRSVPGACVCGGVVHQYSFPFNLLRVKKKNIRLDIMKFSGLGTGSTGGQVEFRMLPGFTLG